jgi:thiol:disulfide interchange protein
VGATKDLNPQPFVPAIYTVAVNRAFEISPVADSVEIPPRVRAFAVTGMNTFGSNRHRPLGVPVTLSAHRFTFLGNARNGSHEGAHMQKIKLFANYSIPVVWFVVGLVIGCIAVYYPLSTLWEHIIVKPENVTPADGLTVIILSVVAGVFVGSAALFGSAQRRWTPRH